jgi:hypothetical protein
MIGLLTTFTAIAVTAAQAEDPGVTQVAGAIADCYKEMVQFDDGISGAGVVAGAMVSACAKQLGAMAPAQMRKSQNSALTAVLRARKAKADAIQ